MKMELKLPNLSSHLRQSSGYEMNEKSVHKDNRTGSATSCQRNRLESQQPGSEQIHRHSSRPQRSSTEFSQPSTLWRSRTVIVFSSVRRRSHLPPKIIAPSSSSSILWLFVRLLYINFMFSLASFLPAETTDCVGAKRLCQPQRMRMTAWLRDDDVWFWLALLPNNNGSTERSIAALDPKSGFREDCSLTATFVSNPQYSIHIVQHRTIGNEHEWEVICYYKTPRMNAHEQCC